MTELLYFTNSYLNEFSAKVIEVIGNDIVLDKTAFYPTGGGQPHDVGMVLRGGEEFGVVGVCKKDGKVIHTVEKTGLHTGDIITGKIDWQRRYKLMRMHTTAHLLSALFYTRAGVLITGNQLNTDKSRIDFNLETLDKELITQLVTEANAAIVKDVPVKVYSLPREDAMNNPDIVKLAGALPPSIATLRIVEIQGIDVQADGGTHVKSLSEIGKIEILSLENKGKNNRRLYFTVTTLL